MTRILLVDDHAMVRDAIRMVLEQDPSMRVVAEAGDGESALRIVAELAPDVVIMDVALPAASGIETTRTLLARQPSLKVLALLTYPDPGIVEQMLAAGASGYITKSAAGVELMRGIRGVLAGQMYLCPEVAALAVTDRLSRPRPGSAASTG